MKPTRHRAGTFYFKCVCPTVNMGLPSLNLVGSRGVGRCKGLTLTATKTQPKLILGVTGYLIILINNPNSAQQLLTPSPTSPANRNKILRPEIRPLMARMLPLTSLTTARTQPAVCIKTQLQTDGDAGPQPSVCGGSGNASVNASLGSLFWGGGRSVRRICPGSSAGMGCECGDDDVFFALL